MKNSVRILAVVSILAALGVASPSAQNKEGIKVHGDWTIEVRNPDGTLVSRHEFKNALVPGHGDATLAGLLGRVYSSGRWRVDLDGSARLCMDASGGRISCASTEFQPPPGAESWMFPTLRVTTPPVPPGFPAVTTELTGTITAAFDGNITTVSSFVQLCPRTVAPDLCGGDNVVSVPKVTEKILPSPISVAAGRVVQFKVVLSFS